MTIRQQHHELYKLLASLHAVHTSLHDKRFEHARLIEELEVAAAAVRAWADKAQELAWALEGESDEEEELERAS